MRTNQSQLVPSTDHGGITGDLGADVTSAPLSLESIFAFAIELGWVGASPVGAFKLQASISGQRWSDLPGSENDLSGNSGSYLYNMDGVAYSFVRLVYTRTSGTGQLTVISKVKGF